MTLSVLTLQAVALAAKADAEIFAAEFPGSTSVHRDGLRRLQGEPEARPHPERAPRASHRP